MSESISKIFQRCGSDKHHKHTYSYFYDSQFASYDKQDSLDILEVGVWRGGSLVALREYFPNANITGVDIVDQRLEENKRDDIEFVISDIKEYRPGKEFDIIIEDGSHSNEDALWAGTNLAQWLKPDGILIIEDVQEGYVVPMVLWGKLLGDYVVTSIDLRRVTDSHDNFLVVIHKVSVYREKTGENLQNIRLESRQ